jgi:dihydrofolate reductase
VVSTTLDNVTWQNSTLIKGNLAEELTRLKAQPGKTITVTGSPTLVQSLLQQGLLDELTLMVHPVVVGKGKRLFPAGFDLKRLQLVSNKTTSSGVAILTYQPKPEPQTE